MTIANPSMHARAGADALTRLVRDVKSGRAQWTHPQHVRQGVDELTRAAAAMAETLLQLTSALGELERMQNAPLRTEQRMGALHRAAQAAATTADQLRQARRTMH